MRAPRRANSTVPLVLIGIGAGLVVVFLILNSAMTADPNRTVFEKMVDLEKRGLMDMALAAADEADPSGDQEYYRKIIAERESLKSRKAAAGSLGSEKDAERAYYQMENWIQQNRNDINGIVSRLEQYIREWEGRSLHWSRIARQELDRRTGRAPPGPAPDPGGRPAAPPAGGTNIDRAYETVRSEVEDLVDSDRFQAAVDAWWAFWERNQLLTDRIEEWKSRVEDEVRSVEARAEERWKKLDRDAKGLVDRGEYEMAARIYREVVETFRMPKYVEMANAAMKKLKRD